MKIWLFSGDDYITDSVTVSSFESASEFFPLRHITIEEHDLVLIAQLVTEDECEPGTVFAEDFDFTSPRDLNIHSIILDSYLDIRMI